MLRRPKVLLVSNDEAESSLLEGILSEHVVLYRIRDLLELLLELYENREGGYDAVFCGSSFQNGTWNEALEYVQQRNPDMPVILCSRTGGEREWIEALEAGAFDLLVPPYGKLGVLAVLEQAVDSYEARRLA